MTRLVVSDALSDQLDAAGFPVELCDRTGRVLGQFIPTVPITPEQAAADGCPCSVEELQEAWRQTGGRTWPQIKADLEQA